jgi:hypothetical protein
MVSARRSSPGGAQMLLVEMILLGLGAFAAMIGFIRFCDWV